MLRSQESQRWELCLDSEGLFQGASSSLTLPSPRLSPPPPLQSCLNLIFSSQRIPTPIPWFPSPSSSFLKKFPRWCVVSILSQSCNAQLCQELCAQGRPEGASRRCQPGRRDPAFLGAGFPYTPNGQELKTLSEEGPNWGVLGKQTRPLDVVVFAAFPDVLQFLCCSLIYRGKLKGNRHNYQFCLSHR